MIAPGRNRSCPALLAVLIAAWLVPSSAVAFDAADSLRKGAFIDWFRHPLLKAILLPSTAPAILILIQALFY